MGAKYIARFRQASGSGEAGRRAWRGRDLGRMMTVEPGSDGGLPALSTATAMVAYRYRPRPLLMAASRAARRRAAALPPHKAAATPTSAGTATWAISRDHGAVIGR